MEQRGKKRIDMKKKSDERRLKLIEMFGDQCKICEKTMDAPNHYQFHHRNPDTKSFTLSGNDLCRSWEIIIVEAEKCDLLCVMCHIDIHGG